MLTVGTGTVATVSVIRIGFGSGTGSDTVGSGGGIGGGIGSIGAAVGFGIGVIGGDTATVIESLLHTGVGYVICPSETDQHAFMATMERFPDVMVRVNMNPEIISRGEMTSVKAEVDRALVVAAGRKNVCIGTGVLPFESDPNVVHAIRDYIASQAR